MSQAANRSMFALPYLVAVCIGCLAAPAACSHRAAAPTSGRPAQAPSVFSAEAWRRRIPPPGQRGVVAFPVPELHTLPNGLTVYLVPRPGGVVSHSVIARCDTSALPHGKSGLAALTTRMLTEGTRHRSALQLAEAAESLGSALEDETGRDYCRVGQVTLPADAGAGLELLAEVVQEPAFLAAEFARVQAEWIDGLVAERQNPLRLAALAGLRLLLGATAGAPVGGSVPDVRRLNVDDLAKFHARTFVPSNSALLVVGDIRWEQLELQVERSFGAWAGPEPAAPPALNLPSPPRQTRVVVVDRPGAVQTAIFVAQPLPARSAAGHEARQLLSSLVGGLFTSRLNTNLREQHGYTYGSYSRAIATRRWGAFVVSTAVQSEVTAPAFEQLRSELRAAQNADLGRPITADEVQRARADLTSSLGARLQSVQSVAAVITTQFIHGLPADYHSGYERRFAAITRDAVAVQARTHLLPERLLVVLVGDGSSLEPALSAAGIRCERASAELLE